MMSRGQRISVVKKQPIQSLQPQPWSMVEFSFHMTMT